MTKRIRIELLSDACFSMPRSAHATVDTDFATDRLGLPRIPGKTIHGLLRDTWLACRGFLDQQEVGYNLFGRTQAHAEAASLCIGDAVLGGDVVDWIRWARYRKEADACVDIVTLRNAFLDTRTQTSIDRERGAPATDTLRVTRVAPKGTVFWSPLTFLTDVGEDETVLLERLLKLTRHAGLHRNRGLGHVRITLHDAVPGSESSWQESLRNKNTVFLPVTINLIAPCLISGRQLEPNSQSTLPFISGAALRGAVAAALPPEHSEVLERLVGTGEVQLLNAYSTADNARALPVPATWRRTKDATKRDHAAEPHDSVLELMGDCPADTCNQRARLGSSFCGANGAIAEVKIVAGTHQARDRTRGVTSEGGEDNVFVYHALEEGQSFRGAICLPANAPELYSAIRDSMIRPLRLGRSARNQYGGAPTISVSPPESVEPGATVYTPLNGEEFLVRFTADAIIRNPVTGQHDPYALGTVLDECFAGTASVVRIASAADSPATFIDDSISFGYNRLWRTSVPEVPCIEAGSIVVMKALIDLGRAAVLEFQARPIGERVAEGKGRFVIAQFPGAGDGNGNGSHAKLSLYEPISVPDPEPTGDCPEVLTGAQRRIFEREARDRAADWAVSWAIGVGKGNLPSPSFLQRLRMLLRRDDWQSRLKEHLRDEDNRRQAARVKSGTESLYSILNTGNGAPDSREEAPIELIIIPKQSADKVWADALEHERVRRYRLNVLLTLLAKKSKSDHRQNDTVPEVEKSNAR